MLVSFRRDRCVPKTLRGAGSPPWLKKHDKLRSMKTAEFIRSPIRQLSDQLANQIAAGEVVERPASIVKELIENSLDAGATTIEIEILKGGFELIKIRDNGCGIPKQELVLAVQAHCTSKISSFDDLTSIASMGFRGEALASIVSISRFEITSSTSSQEMAWTWSGNNGSGNNGNGDNKAGSHALNPASHPVGTSIHVRDIFYNTMARRKFLRSERTEFRHIEDVVKRIALSRFDVEIILKHNQRVVYRLTPALTADLKLKRIEKLLDKNFIRQAVQVSYQASQLTMTGWLSNKDYSRGQTDMQYFYVNGRMVKDKVINHALRQVYQALVPPGRFPAYVLNLQLDPQQVDVNVHPTKHEVRFRQMRLVHDFVNHVIQDSLAKINSELHAQSAAQDSATIFNEPAKSAWPDLGETALSYGISQRGAARYSPEHVSPVAAVSENNKQSGSSHFLLGSAVGFCQPYYLISHSQQGMVILHLLRVAQHLVEQQWLKQCSLNTVEVKPFVFPLSIDLNNQLCGCIDAQQPMLQSLGFDVSLQSSSGVLLRAAPTVLKHCDFEMLLKQLLTSLQMENGITAPELIQLLSRFVALDASIESQTLEHWNHYLRLIENSFEAMRLESPYKNKLWRVLSVTEVNKLFQTNVTFELHSDN